jgi:hypothetical protein
MSRRIGSGRRSRRIGLPDAKSADKDIGVIARAATWREILQFLDVSSPENDVVRLESGDQQGNHVRDMSPPPLLAEPIEPAFADVVFLAPLLVREVAQFHGLDNRLHNHSGTQAGSQAEEKHRATLVASERLHRINPA